MKNIYLIDKFCMLYNEAIMILLSLDMSYLSSPPPSFKKKMFRFEFPHHIFEIVQADVS